MAQQIDRHVPDNKFSKQKGTGITSVKFNDDCKTVGENAFLECSELSSINNSNRIETISSKAFAHTGITSVSLTKIKTIGNNAFEGCKELKSISINNSCEFIGDSAFQDCNKLSSVSIPNNKYFTKINDRTFQQCAFTSITIPSYVTTIGSAAFNNCSALTSVTMGYGVETIGNNAFNGCNKIEGVYITNIDSWCGIKFDNEKSNPLSNSTNNTYLYEKNIPVTDIDISDGVSDIKSNVFYNYKNLNRIILPSTVSAIGNNAFYGCENLKTVVNLTSLSIRKGNEDNGHVAKYANRVIKGTSRINDFIFNKESNKDNKLVYHLKSDVSDITLPTHTYDNKPYDVDNGVFNEHNNISRFEIPDNTAKVIGNEVFNGCTKMTDVYISDSPNELKLGYNWYHTNPSITTTIDSIGFGLFKDCPIKNLYLGRNLTYDYSLNAGCSPFARTSLTSVSIGSKVTKIGNQLFRECKEIKTITIPDNVTDIGHVAFYRCNNITNVSIGRSVKTIGDEAFNGCTSLTDVTFPSSLESIGKHAFYGCTGITNVEMGNSLSEIKEGAFRNCTGIKTINIPNSVTTLCSRVFEGCSALTSVSIGSGVQNLEEQLFYNCNSLANITIPNNITEIKNNVFNGCSSLKEIIIDEIEDMGDSDSDSNGNDNTHTPSPVAAEVPADSDIDSEQPLILGYNTVSAKGLLYGCPLTNVYIGRDIDYNTGESYGYSPFYGISTLTSVTIGNKVTTVGSYAFSNCSNLTSVSIGDSVTSIDDNAFSYCKTLPSIAIPNSIKTIGYKAFYNCDSLTDVTIPNSVTNIGDYAFSDCDNLNKTTIGNSVTSIGDYAFEGCGLTKITIGNNVNNIGLNAFVGCSYIENVIYTNNITSWCKIKFENENSNPASFSQGFCFNEDGEKIKNLIIPNNITQINNYAFYKFASLENIIIPNSVESIGDSAFNFSNTNKYNIKRVVIGNGVTNIGKKAFYFTYINDTPQVGIIIIGKNFPKLSEDSSSDSNSIYHYNSNKKINFSKYYYENCINIEESVQKGDFMFNIPLPNNDYDSKEYYLYSYMGDGVSDLYLPSDYYGNTYNIGECAFYNCDMIESITIPNGVISIGECAFNGCNSLKYIHIEDGDDDINYNKDNNLFLDCKSTIQTVYLGRNISYLDDIDNESKYYTCLKTFIIGNNINDFTGNELSKHSPNIKRIIIGNNVTNIGYDTFNININNHIIINLSKSEIPTTRGYVGYNSKKIINYIKNEYDEFNSYKEGDFIFATKDNSSILCVYFGDDTELTLPNYYKNDNRRANIYSLSHLTYYIGEYAFYGCNNITNVTIGNMVINIENNAFEDCCYIYNDEEYGQMYGGLKYVNIHNRIEYIGHNVFNGCNALEIIIIGKNTTTNENKDTNEQYIEDILGNSFTDDTNKNNLKIIINFSENLKTKSLDDKVINVYDDEYINKNVEFDGGLISSNYVFVEMENNTLCGYIGNETNLTLPKNYKGNDYVIGDFAFYEQNITSITIPNTVTNIGDSAFESALLNGNYDSSPLTTVTFNNNSKVEKIGFAAFRGCYNLTNITFPDSVTSIGDYAFYINGIKELVIGKNVTNIGDFAFANGDLLTSVTMSNGVTSIGESAFQHCKELTNITIPNSVTSIGEYAFDNTNIFNTESNIYYIGRVLYLYTGSDNNTIDIKSDTLGIADGAFRDNGDITSIEIPNKVINIGKNAFNGCNSLTNIIIGKNVTTIGENAFYGCENLKIVINFSNIEIYKGSTSNGYVGYYVDKVINAPNGSIVDEKFVFSKIDGVNTLCGYIGDDTELTLPTNYKGENYVIGSSVFEGCSNLTSVTIPNSVTNIGNNAFSCCNSLTIITIPNSVTNIGDYAFYDCNINNVTFESKSNVSNIGVGAFYGCKSLKDIIIPESVTSIGAKAFYNCNRLTNITIPNSVTIIGNSAFSGCSYATNITIGSNVTDIGEYAFNGCSNITSIEIPNNVVNIYKYAFYGCSRLTSVTIGNDDYNTQIKYIGEYAFYNRYTNNYKTILENVYIYAKSAPNIGENVFYVNDIINGRTQIYVPIGSKGYTDTNNNWNRYYYHNGVDVKMINVSL